MAEAPQVPEGLSLDEYRMRLVYYSRTASRLPVGSEEKRSALEQVRLNEQMIDSLRRQGRAKPGVSSPALPYNNIETARARQASALVWDMVPNVPQAYAYHRRTPGMFIQLTQLNGTPILINTNSICHVMAEGEERSLLSLSGPNMMALTVRESYTEVLEKLGDCGAHLG
jgi:uncharacterized protein YlzI (FlbEa/FlbD family)